MKAIIFSLFLTMIFCGNNLRQNVLLQETGDYVEDKRDYDEYATVKLCKIQKCIFEKRYENLAAIYGEFSAKYNQEQQKCFQYCQINAKCGRKEDAQGRKMNGIYDENETGFFDTAPCKQDIKEYLKVNENKVLRRFLEKHMFTDCQ